MSDSDTDDIAARRRAVGEARDDWRTAEAEVNRVRTVHARLRALAERADRRVEADRASAVEAFERFGRQDHGREDEEGSADRREQLRYLDEPLVTRDGAETAPLLLAREGVALDGPTATFFDRLSAFVGEGDETPAWSGTDGSVTAAFAAVLDDEGAGSAAYETRLDALTTLFGAAIEAATNRRDAREAALNDALGDYVSAGGAIPDDLDGQPIALFPVRLETRFVSLETDRVVANTGDPDELRVRVYPDQIHVDSHERALTDEEVRVGEAFWATVWYAAHRTLPEQAEGEAAVPEDYYDSRLPDRVRAVVDAVDPAGYSTDATDRYAELKERAWGRLVDRHGRERGAFVVHATAPEDPPDHEGDSAFSDELLYGPAETATPDGDGSFVPLPTLSFPEVPRQPESWTRRPRARLLPDRWVAVARWRTEAGAERRETFVGGAVREPLPVGPNPEQVAEAGGTSIDPDRPAPPGMEWMVDFDRAEAVGMALRIPGEGGLSSLDGFDPRRGFTRLTVLGVRSSSTPEESTDDLRDLLEAHHYTDGLSLLSHDTPTNVHDTDSGYSSADAPAETVAVEAGPPLVSDADRSDGDLLARALGIGGTGSGSAHDHVFAHVENADATTQRDARHVNTVLWPATIGYYAQHLLMPAASDAPFSGPLRGGTDDPLPPPGRRLQWLDAYRRHFVRYVRSRGPLPAIRTGEQPYGVLPVAPVVGEAERAADGADRTPLLDDELLGRLREALEGLDLGLEVEAGRPLADYVRPDVPVERYLDAGLPPEDLYRAGVPAADLRGAGVDLGSLAAMGVPAEELVEDAPAGDLIEAGYEVPELLEAGETVEDFAAAGVPVADLVRAGVDSRALLDAYPVATVVSAGVAPGALLSAGVPVETLVGGGVPLADLRNAGVSASALRASGRTAGELGAAGYTASALRDAGFSAETLSNAGFDEATLAAAGFRAADLREAGVSAETLSTRFDPRALRLAGYTATELRRTGFEADALVDAGYTASELLAAGVGVDALVGAGVDAGTLRNAGASASDLRDAGVDAGHLREAGFSANELRSTGLSASELQAAGFAASELRAAGFGAPALVEAGVDAGTLARVGFDAPALVDAGLSPDALRRAGFGASALAEAGLDRDALAGAGFGAAELATVSDLGDSTGGLEADAYGSRVTVPATFAERSLSRLSFDPGLSRLRVPTPSLEDDPNHGTDGGRAAVSQWLPGTRDHLVPDHLADLVRTAETHWAAAVDGLDWTTAIGDDRPRYTEATLTKLLGRRAHSSSLRLEGWFGLPNATRHGDAAEVPDATYARAHSGQVRRLSTALPIDGLAEIGPRIAHLLDDGEIDTEVLRRHLVGPDDATFLRMLANEPLETVRRIGYRLDEDALGIRWNQVDVDEAVRLVNDVSLTPKRRTAVTTTATTAVGDSIATDVTTIADSVAIDDDVARAATPVGTLSRTQLVTAAALGVDWQLVGEAFVPRLGENTRWDDLTPSQRIALLSHGLKNAGSGVSTAVLDEVVRAVGDSATPQSTPSIEKLVTMFELALDYDDQPALLSSALRLLTAFGTQHEYLAGRLRLGFLTGTDTQVAPERARYGGFDASLYASLFQPAPEAIVDDPDAPPGVDPDDTFADILFAAAGDDPETTAIYPRISEYADSLQYLADAFGGADARLPESAQESLLLETLDLASHRLDAWWTSLATKRLFELRMVQEGRDGEDGGSWSELDLDADTGSGSWRVSPVAGSLAREGLDLGGVTDATGTGTTDVTGGATVGSSVETPTFLRRAAATLSRSEVSAHDAGLFRVLPREEELPASVAENPALDELLVGVGAVESDPGIYVGAYGFVEDLRPDPAGTDPEYLHAPSQQHARTAAILRSAHQAHGQGDGRTSSGVGEAVAVDLSADRVREAKRLIDGVRRGQSLEELLGYRFERRLHEASDGDVNLVRHKDTFRRLFPVQKEGVGDRAGAGGESTPTELATVTVVDGRAVVEAWPLSAAGTSPQRRPLVESLPAPGSEAFRRLDGVVGELEDALDAVGDLLLAESVHQLGQGNFDAAGASLDTLSQGEVPPELTVTRTPRSAVGVTHRTFVVLDDPATATVPDAWATDGMGAVTGGGGTTGRVPGNVRGRAEPALNAWLGDLFPAPDRIRCVATYRWEREGEPTGHRTVVSFADLGFSPLDALYVTATDPDPRPGASELEARIGYLLARREATDLPDGADLDLRIRFAETAVEGETLPSDAVSVAEFLELARSTRDLLAETRPADAADLAHPTEDRGPGYGEDAVGRPGSDGDETARRRSLVARADDVQRGLEAVAERLEDRLSVLAPEATPPTADGDGDGSGGGSGSGDGDRDGGDPDTGPTVDTDTDTDVTTNGLETEPPGLTTRVDALVGATRSFADAVPLDGLADEVEDADARALLDDLSALAGALPAGPTTAADATEQVVVESTTGQSITGIASPAPRAGEPVGPAPEGDEDGGDGSPGEGSGDRREDDSGEGVDPSDPREIWERRRAERISSRLPPELRDLRERRRLERRRPGSTEPGEPGEQGEPGEPGEPPDSTTPTEPTEPPQPPEPTTLEVSVWSRSPTAWFTRSATVEADPDGAFAVSFDFGDVEPGTAFELVATEVPSGRVAYAAVGRVVAVDGSEESAAAAVVEGSETLSGLLELAAVRDRFAVPELDAPTTDDGTAGDGAPVETRSDADGTSPAAELHAARSALDWDALRREGRTAQETLDRGAAPRFDAADLGSIDALVGLAETDPVAVDEAVESVVDPLARVGLPDAVDLVTTEEGRSAYVSEGVAADLRNRLERGVADPARLRLDAPADLLDFHPLFAELLRQIDPEVTDPGTAARDVRALLDHPVSLAESLDGSVDAPHAVLRGLAALAYHGDRGDPSFATRLRAVGSVAERIDGLFADTPDPAANRRRLGRTLVELADLLGRVYVAPPSPPFPDRATQQSAFEAGYADALSGLVGTLRDAADRTTAVLDASPSPSNAVRGVVLESLRPGLVEASRFGVFGSTPESATGRSTDDEAALVAQTRAVLARIAVRVRTAAPLDPSAADLEARPVEELVADQRTRLEALLDDAFVVLPPFRPTNGPELRATFDDDGLLEGAPPLAAETWLRRSARTRERVAAVAETTAYAEATTGRLRPSLAVGQIPHAADGGTWIGIDGDPDPGGLSLVAQFDAGGSVEALDASAPVTGLFVDEWVEDVPSEEETTGVALNYDEPGARPPQSILLAVPPTDRTWSVEAIEETVEETTSFARYRSVDLGDLAGQDAVTQLLPALLFPKNSNARPDAPSVDFDMLHRYNPIYLVAILTGTAFLPSMLTAQSAAGNTPTGGGTGTGGGGGA